MNSDIEDVRPNQAEVREYGIELGLFAIRLGACVRELRDVINQRLKMTDLIEVEFLVLSLLASEPDEPLSQTQLGARLGVSPARLSKAVEYLRASGLLIVQRDRDDRRRQFVQLTPNGQQRVSAAIQRISPLIDRCRSRWSAERLNRWVEDAIQLMAMCREMDRAKGVPAPATQAGATIQAEATVQKGEAA